MSRYNSGPIFGFCPFLSHLGIFKYVLWNRPASVIGPFPPQNVARQCSVMGCTRACSRIEPAFPRIFSNVNSHSKWSSCLNCTPKTSSNFFECRITPSEWGVPEISACPLKSQGVLILGDGRLWGHYVA